MGRTTRTYLPEEEEHEYPMTALMRFRINAIIRELFPEPAVTSEQPEYEPARGLRESYSSASTLTDRTYSGGTHSDKMSELRERLYDGC